jgi:hypothetical protein
MVPGDGFGDGIEDARHLGMTRQIDVVVGRDARRDVEDNAEVV